MNDFHDKPGVASALLQLNNDRKSIQPVKPVDTRKGVGSVDLAFDILRIFESSGRALAVKEIAERVNMPASKVHHYLVSLVRSSILRQNTHGSYELGEFALHLGLSAMRKIEPIELGAAAARKFRDLTGEAVFISVWGSHGPTIIRYYEGSQPVTVEARAGLVLPVLTSATGHVFITWGDVRMIKSTAQLEKNATDINQIRKRTAAGGLGSVDGDLLPRIASLSAPVFDQDGSLVLAVTTLGWSGEFDVTFTGKLATELKLCTHELSSQLGYR